MGEEVHAYIDRGKLLIVKMLAVGAVNPDNGTREVFFELNAEPRSIVSAMFIFCPFQELAWLSFF